MTSIGSHAFGGCFGLNSVAIPNSVTTIGEGAFEGCSRLTSITIPSSVTAIGDNAFNRCTNLTSITIPGNVTSLGTNAFRGCSGLKKVIISNMAAWCRISINNYLASPLYYSHHLYDENDIEIKDLVIPSDVTSINDYTFYGCTSLTSVTIPGSVTSIGKSVFKDIDIPTVVTLIANPFDIYGESSLFAAFNQNTFKNATLYVPKGTVELYKATEGWKDFKFIEEDNSHSSIESVRDEDPGGHDYYDLGGRKISTPKKGLHINRGSKVIVK